MTEVIQIDTFSRLVAEKDGEIVYLKYVTLFVSSALEKPEIILLFVLFGERYIHFVNHFVRPVLSKVPSYPLQIYKLEVVKWILPFC